VRRGLDLGVYAGHRPGTLLHRHAEPVLAISRHGIRPRAARDRFDEAPVTALLALLTIPLALRVSAGLEPNYDNPYGLMAIMGVNIQLHLVAGLALVAAYLVVLAVHAVAPSVPLFLG